jgi:hypothetical protein
MTTVRAMMRRRVWSTATCLGVLALVAGGCRSAERAGAGSGTSSPRRSRSSDIHGVRCLYDQKPWINADAAGDPDPEGIRYRVFLDPGTGRCVLRDGSFRIELYQIDRTDTGGVERVLVSDWNYPTSEFGTVVSKILGKGYHVQLRWGKKNIAGHEIEVITQFIDRDGATTRSATKRLRVPKYSP